MIDSTGFESSLPRQHTLGQAWRGRSVFGCGGMAGGSNAPVPSTTTSYSGAISSMVDIAEKREVRYGKRKADVGKWKRKKVLLGLPRGSAKR